MPDSRALREGTVEASWFSEEWSALAGDRDLFFGELGGFRAGERVRLAPRGQN